MKLLFAALAVVAVFLFLRWRRNVVVVDEESGTSQLRSDDADMQRAMAEAKTSFSLFADRLRNPMEGDDSFAVKVAIAHEAGTENIWLSDVRVMDDGVSGTIANDPIHVPLKLGDAWHCSLAQVVDWTYMANGRMQGNFTLRAVLPRMPANQRRQFSAMLEGRWDLVALEHRPWPSDAAMPGSPLPADISHGDGALMREVPAHLTRMLGTAVPVFHEIVSPSAHIDLYPYPPTPSRPYLVVATTGMAEKPMQVPANEDRHVELLVALPPDWPLDPKQWTADERHYWPLRWLKRVARFHYETGHWLGEGHVLDHGDPARIIADSGAFTSVLLASPSILPEAGQRVSLKDGRQVRLLQLYFLDAQARALVADSGWQAYLVQRNNPLSV